MRIQSPVPRWPLNLSLLFCLAVVGGCSCAPAGELVPEPEPELGECRRSVDCGAGAVCSEGFCVQIFCNSDADCDSDRSCDLPTGICVASLDCDEDNPCAVDERCEFTGETAVCVVDSEPLQTECRFFSETIVARHGQARELIAFSFDVDGGRQWREATFTFESEDESTLLVESAGALALCSGESACRTTVTATDQLGATCTADVFVLPPVADETFEIVVLAPESLSPVLDAEVTLVRDEATESARTDADGRAIFDRPTFSTVVLASVFAEGRRWQSVAHPQGDDVLLLPPREVPPGETFGVVIESDLSSAISIGDIAFNLAGVGSFDPLQDWGPKELRGESRELPVSLEGVTSGPIDALFDSATQIKLGVTPLTEVAFVRVADPRPRTPWAIGSNVRLADIGPLLASSSDFRLPFSEYAPLFVEVGIGAGLVEARHFASVEEAVVSPSGPGVLLDEDAVVIDVFRHRSATVTLPALPCRDGFDPFPGEDVRCRSGRFVDDVLVIIGARQASGEFVVLGISSGQDLDGETGQADGRISRFNQATVDRNDTALVTWAPGYNGVHEDELYAMLVTDIDDDLVEADNAGDRVWAKVEGGTIDFADFPAPPAGRWAVNSSVYTPISSPGGLQRLRLEGESGGWDVFFTSADSAIVPLAGVGAESADGRLESVYTESYFLETATPKDIFQLSGTNLDTLSDSATARSGRRCVPQFGQPAGRRCFME